MQQLAFIKQCPLYGIYVDLQKSYNKMDCKRVIDILRDTGVGPETLWLVVKF